MHRISKAALCAILPLALLLFFHARVLAGPETLPPVLAQAAGFTGRITYTGRRLDLIGGASVRGVLVVEASSWSLDEYGLGYAFHAGSGGAQASSGGASAAVDDPFEMDGLTNAWAVAFGMLHAQPLAADGAPRRIWTGASGLRAYVDAAGDRLVGIADAASPLQTSFVFGDWLDENGVWVPRSIVRLKGGAQDAAFALNSYAVQRTGAALTPADGSPALAARHGVSSQSTQMLHPMWGADTDAAWRQLAIFFALLAIGALGVAWLRRDAIIQGMCTRLARDERAFRDAGESVFVSPEGVLYFDGRAYLVGPRFYARSARVQISPLFLRVSAAGAGPATVVARKFQRVRRRGFTLIEVLMAVTIFGIFIVGCVFPTLAAISQADAVAARRETASRLAANALGDEELAAAYGPALVPGSSTTTADDMQVTVTVANAPTPGGYDVSVVVRDGERALASVMTTVGPPVPAPVQSARP